MRLHQGRTTRRLSVAVVGLMAVALFIASHGGDAAVRASGVGGAIHEVTLNIMVVEGAITPEFFFEPADFLIQPGDTVRFVAATPHHTVTAYHMLQGKSHRVSDGVEPFSSPVLPIGTAWDYTFAIPGVYDLWCAPHEVYGMVMRLVVGEVSGPGATPPDDFGPFGTTGLAGAVLSDPALDPENIAANGSIAWVDVSSDIKDMIHATE